MKTTDKQAAAHRRNAARSTEPATPSGKAIERQFYKAIDQLERLQRLRASDPVAAPVKIDVTTDLKQDV